MRKIEERKQKLNRFIKYDLNKIEQGKLKEAMKYAIFSGGKRMRPQLCMAASNSEENGILPIAAAVEYIHTYSLIHDDLPSMDNDDTRRGKASVHKKFGNAIAILAGDAFLTDAFRLVTETQADSGKIADMINILSRSSGSSGMVAGQVDDIIFETDLDENRLLFIAEQKTGKLIRASVLVGTIFAGRNKNDTLLFDKYAQAVGLAYQLSDDIKDINEDGFNYASVSGEEKTKVLICELIDRAKDCLKKLEMENDFLSDFCTIIEKRSQM